jgi:hypothetical protein
MKITIDLVTVAAWGCVLLFLFSPAFSSQSFAALVGAITLFWL